MESLDQLTSRWILKQELYYNLCTNVQIFHNKHLCIKKTKLSYFFLPGSNFLPIAFGFELRRSCCNMKWAVIWFYFPHNMRNHIMLAILCCGYEECLQEHLDQWALTSEPTPWARAQSLSTVSPAVRAREPLRQSTRYALGSMSSAISPPLPVAQDTNLSHQL